MTDKRQVRKTASLGSGKGPDWSQRDQFALAVADLIDKGHFHEVVRRFTPELANVVNAAALRAGWASVNAELGVLLESRVVEHTADGHVGSVVICLTFELGTAELRIDVIDCIMISGIRLVPVREWRYEQPDYVDRATFHEADMAVDHSGQLPGTLSMPTSVNPCSAILLIHGSGPHDRNETIGRNAPFQDLAWGLASRGIAVLRYDKRTFVDPSSLITSIDDEVVDDAVCAIDALRSVDGVDPSRIYVLGHSLGGMLAPRIAARSTLPAGVVMAAAPSRFLPVVIAAQADYLLSALPEQASPQERAALCKLKADAERLSSVPPDFMGADQAPLGAPGTYWRSLAEYNAVEEAQQLRVPLLVLQGARDYQLQRDDFVGWRQGLQHAGTTTFRWYEALDHLFRSGTGPTTPSSYDIAGHVAREVIEDIAAWINLVGR